MVKALNIIIMMISILLSVAFFTLMERKWISFSQNRKGPNKTLFIGILQPISDAIKLITKEINLNLRSNKVIYFMAPALNLVISLTVWMIMPIIYEFKFMKMSTLFMISCMAINTITLMMMSWASNSNYAFIGMMRTISQLISYEINFMFIIFIIINITNQMNLNLMWMTQVYIPIAVSLLPVALIWLMTILAETNRTPFDFSEGESELVSGFNIEYSSKSFMLLFLSEYSSILLMSMITAFMYFSFKLHSPSFYLTYTLISFFFIWSRITFPRFRYDKLMKLNWTQLLPITTLTLYASFTFKFYCTIKS